MAYRVEQFHFVKYSYKYQRKCDFLGFKKFNDKHFHSPSLEIQLLFLFCSPSDSFYLFLSINRVS